MRLTSRLLFSLLLACSAEGLGRRSLQHVGKAGLFPRLPLSRGAETIHLHDYTRRQDNTTGTGTTPSFLNSASQAFVVNGSAIPDVAFDVGPSFAGQLPISSSPGEQSKLYFWFFPSTNPKAEKEILIWLNGGPGCSSLEGFLQENGPFLWQYGTFKPVANPYSWHRLTNMVWVEQPVGTGFSTGKVTATSEADVAAQFLGFWKNFVTTFAMQGYKVYIAGESYAGQYCPYIASAMLDKNDTTTYNMKGMLIYDPVINYDVVTEQIPAAAFVDTWPGLHPFNASFLSSMHAKAKSCGYTDFLDKYLTYPPKSAMPSRLPGTTADGVTAQASCDVWGDVINAALDINPCWDIYQVATTCPLLWDVLGFPGTLSYVPDGSGPLYFNRPDVKKAINAPVDFEWEECTSADVFVNGRDSSLPSGLTVLPGVIDRTQNVMISHGALDFVLIANGTLLAIQNMTFGGSSPRSSDTNSSVGPLDDPSAALRGFQKPPLEPFVVPFHNEFSLATLAGSGVFGTAHTERGLTYVGVDLAGHMVPQYAPSAAFRQLEFLLGRLAGQNGVGGKGNGLTAGEPFTVDPATGVLGAGVTTAANKKLSGAGSGVVRGAGRGMGLEYSGARFAGAMGRRSIRKGN